MQKGYNMSAFISSEFIKELDGFFTRNDLAAAGEYLSQSLDLCRREGNRAGMLTVLDECVGYYRQTGDEQAGMNAVNGCLDLITEMRLDDKTSGTILLNCATTMKAFGKAEEAMEYYRLADEKLTRALPPDDPLIAGLYNNEALALQDIGEIAEAEESFLRALEITGKNDSTALEYAVTCVNLAHLRFDRDYLDVSVNELLDSAYKILSDDRFISFPRYGFTCRKCAPAYGFFGRIADEKEISERGEKY